MNDASVKSPNKFRDPRKDLHNKIFVLRMEGCCVEDGDGRMRRYNDCS